MSVTDFGLEIIITECLTKDIQKRKHKKRRKVCVFSVFGMFFVALRA